MKNYPKNRKENVLLFFREQVFALPLCMILVSLKCWKIGLLRGSKIKSALILFKSMSDNPTWLKSSKNIIIIIFYFFFFWMRLIVFSDLIDQRLEFRLCREKKIKLLQFSWKWCQIVHLLESFQKKNSLRYLKFEVIEIRWKKGLLPEA